MLLCILAMEFQIHISGIILYLRALVFGLLSNFFFFGFIHLHWFYFNTVRGREASFNSAKLSFLSVISDEGVLLLKDPLKAYASSAAPQTLENGCLEIEEMKVCGYIKLLLLSCITLNCPFHSFPLSSVLYYSGSFSSRYTLTRDHSHRVVHILWLLKLMNQLEGTNILHAQAHGHARHHVIAC